MLLTIIWPFLVLLLGFFIYFTISGEKWQKVGFALFCVGALWTVYVLTGSTFSIGGRVR